MNSFRKVVLTSVTVLVVAGATLSMAPNAHATPVDASEPPWPSPQYRDMFMRSCGDCHSNETKWPWYSQLPIVSGFIRRHVEEGREKLNVSEWGTAMQGDHAEHVAEVAQNGEMPPASYLFLHPDARLDAATVQAFVQGANAAFGPQESEEGEGGEAHDK